MRFALFCVFGAALVVGCATYRDDLSRGQRLYLDNQYEHALAIWRLLEPDLDSLTYDEQARYAYLRGMTDYRLGFRSDARHWLALAKAIHSRMEHADSLGDDSKRQLDETLDELNRETYASLRLVAPPEPMSQPDLNQPSDLAAPPASSTPEPGKNTLLPVATPASSQTTPNTTRP